MAKKFVGIMEDLGIYKFDQEDFTTQEGLVEKLDFVKNSIRKMKGNIRELGDQPRGRTSSFNPGEYNRLSNSKLRTYGAND